MVVLLSACVQHKGGPILMNGNDITHTVVQKNGPYYTIEKKVYTSLELAEVDFTPFLTTELKRQASQLCQGEDHIMSWSSEASTFITLKHGASHWELAHKNDKKAYPTGTVVTASFRCRYFNLQTIEKLVANDDTQVALLSTELSPHHHWISHRIHYRAFQRVNGIEVWLKDAIQTKAAELCDGEMQTEYHDRKGAESATFHKAPSEQETFIAILEAEVTCLQPGHTRLTDSFGAD